MIGRKIIIQFLGVGLSSFLSFLTLSVTARFFGANILGEVNYFLGVLGLILIFSDLGFSRAHIKFIAEKRKIREKIGVFLSIKLFLLLCFLVISLLCFYFFLKPATSSVKALSFFVLIFYEFFYRLGASTLLTFEGLQMITIENLIFLLGKLGRLGGIILFLFFAKNIIGLSLSYLIEGLLVLFLAFVVIQRFLPFSWDKITFKNYFYYSLPFFVIYPLSYVQGNIDVVILRNFWTASEVGYYSAAIGLTAFLKTLYGVLITLFFPRISQLFTEGKISKIQQYANLAIKYLLIVFVPLFLTLYFFRSEIIFFVLGQEFRPSIGIFSFSLLAIFILMVSSPYDHLIYAAGKHQILAPLTFFTVLLSIFLQLILVPKTLFSLSLFGLSGMGTVLANIAVWFLAAIVKIYLVYKFFKIKPSLKNLFFFIFSFLTLMLFSVLEIGTQEIIWKIIFLAISFSFFYAFLTIFRIIDRSDVKYLKLTFNPRKIIKEGISELKNEKQKTEVLPFCG